MRKAVLSMVLILGVIVIVSLLWHGSTTDIPNTSGVNTGENKQVPPQTSPKIKVLAEAIQSGDYSSCDNVAQELRQGCIDRITKVRAISSLNLSMCDGIKTSFVKSDCINSINSRIQASKQKYDFSRCDNVRAADMEVCKSNVITSVAERTAKLELCNDVPVKGLDDACRDNVYMALAVKTGDKSYCDKVIDKGKRASCTG